VKFPPPVFINSAQRNVAVAFGSMYETMGVPFMAVSAIGPNAATNMLPKLLAKHNFAQL
jgi:hypothetical protein